MMCDDLGDADAPSMVEVYTNERESHMKCIDQLIGRPVYLACFTGRLSDVVRWTVFMLLTSLSLFCSSSS